MLGDTSGDTDGRGELSNTQPLLVELSSDNRTVLVLAMSNCATGVDSPCAATTVSPGVTATSCQRAWNEVPTHQSHSQVVGVCLEYKNVNSKSVQTECHLRAIRHDRHLFN